jgi:hypothetical protein
MSWLFLAFLWWDSNIYLVFSVFTFRPTSLLASIKVWEHPTVQTHNPYSLGQCGNVPQSNTQSLLLQSTSSYSYSFGQTILTPRSTRPKYGIYTPRRMTAPPPPLQQPSSSGTNTRGASMLIQCPSQQLMRLMDHMTLNFNNRMSTAAVFLDIEKAFDTTWHSGLLYKM